MNPLARSPGSPPAESPPRLPASRWPAAPWLVGLYLLWLAGVAATVLAERSFGFDAELCLFHRLTGWPCPACGTTRGVLNLLAGRVAEAWLANPLMMTFLPLMLAATGYRVARRRWPWPALTGRGRRVVWAAALAALLANWAYLLAAGR